MGFPGPVSYIAGPQKLPLSLHPFENSILRSASTRLPTIMSDVLESSRTVQASADTMNVAR